MFWVSKSLPLENQRHLPRKESISMIKPEKSQNYKSFFNRHHRINHTLSRIMLVYSLLSFLLPTVYEKVRKLPLFIITKGKGGIFYAQFHKLVDVKKCQRRKVLWWKLFSSIRFVHSWAAQLCEEGKISELFGLATHIVIHEIWIMYKAPEKRTKLRHIKTSTIVFFLVRHDVQTQKSNKSKIFSFHFLKKISLPNVFHVNKRNKHKSFEHLSWTSMNLFWYFLHVFWFIADSVLK